MALEPLMPHVEEDDSEVRAVRRKFWIALALALPVVLTGMAPHLFDLMLTHAQARTLHYIELALTAADVVRINRAGKKVAVIGIENGYPLGTDIARVKEFFDRGGRYMSLAHNGHSQLADSHTGEADGVWRWGGLSPLGRQVIQEMNKWGIMVDVSHPSKGAIMQAIGLSRAPVIASHSGVRKLANTSRNMDDETLTAMKTNGGVVQIVGLSGFVKVDPPERGPAITALRNEFGLNAGGGRGGRGGGRGAAPTAATDRRRRAIVR